MYLSRLYIKNYKSIQETDISFEKGKNIIVGRNNAGKSNIINAIDLLLGENSPTWNKSENITEHHFFQGNTEQNIFIWCELGLSENNEKFDFSSISNSAFSKVKDHNIKINYFTEDEIKKLFYFQLEEGNQKLENKEYKKEWIGGKNYCTSDFDSEFSNIKKVAFAFLANKNEDDIIEKYLGFFYTEDEINWKIGIGGEKMRNIFLQSAVIPSFRDPQTQLKINNWSWYSKLLKQYIKPSKELNQAFQSVKTASDNIFDDLKKQVCDSKINIAFPGTKISFQFNPDSEQDVYKNALIYVDDGFNSQLNEKGSGIQSAVIIGLFDFYIRNIAHACCSLLTIEEPELYLHPHGRRVISNRLDQFLDGNKNQVIVTSHSEDFIVPIYDNLNIIVIRKSRDGTKAFNQKFNDPKKRQILIKKQNAEIFFADAVILTEDAKYFIEDASKKYGVKKNIGEYWLNNNNISVINVDGKDWFYKYRNILKELKIPTFTLADFDYLSNGKINEEINDQSLVDRINTFKGKENPKFYDEKTLINKQELDNILIELKLKNIILLKDDLENLYKSDKKPTLSKEQGVIETISKILENEENIEDYIDTSEINSFFDTIVENLNIMEIGVGSIEEKNNINQNKQEGEETILF